VSIAAVSGRFSRGDVEVARDGFCPQTRARAQKFEDRRPLGDPQGADAA
jgi:hypothetical protein